MAKRKRFNTDALTLTQLVRLLQRTGVKGVSAKTIRQHIVRGAPVIVSNKRADDVRFNLVQYMAWMIKELAHG